MEKGEWASTFGESRPCGWLGGSQLDGIGNISGAGMVGSEAGPGLPNR